MINKKTKIIFYFLTCLLLLIPMNLSNAAIEISIDPSSEIKSVERMFFGAGVNWTEWIPPYANAQLIEEMIDGESILTIKKEAIDLFNDAGFTSLRYPGGAKAINFDWQKAIGPLDSRGLQEQYINNVLSYPSYPCLMGPMEFMELCEATGAEPIITIAYSRQDHGSPNEIALAADWVEFMNAENDGSNPRGGIDWASLRASYGHPDPYNVTYWEIGNEAWLRVWEPNYAVYAEDANDYISAMKAVDPTILCGMTGGASEFRDPNRIWNNGLFKDANLAQYLSGVDFVIDHPSSSVGPDRYKLPSHLDNALTELETFISESTTVDQDISITLTEYYPYWTSYGNTTVENALLCADMIRVMMEHDVEIANYWKTINSGEQSIIASVTGSDSDFYYHAIGLPLKLYNKYFLDDTLVDSSGTNIPTYAHDGNDYNDLTFIAGKDSGGDVYIVVINKSETTDRDVTIDVSGASGTNYAEVWVINGPNMDSLNDTYCGIDDRDVVKISHLPLNEVDAVSGFDYTFAAHSVTVMRIGSSLQTGVEPDITFLMEWDDLTGDTSEDKIPDVWADANLASVIGTPIAGDANGTKRGTWDTTGYYVGASEGFQYKALGNVDPNKATIEIWSGRDFGSMSSGVYPKIITFFYGTGDYMNLYVKPDPDGDANYIQMIVQSQMTSQVTNLRADHLRATWPTGASSPGDNGFNHFLFSYDLSQPSGDRWFGLWFNGERVAYTTVNDSSSSLGVFNSNVLYDPNHAQYLNVLTIGNTYDANSVNAANSNLDAIRIVNGTVDQLYALDSNNDFTPPDQYYNTSASENCGCGSPGYSYRTEDITKDCIVDIADHRIILKQWSECTDPNDPDCQ